ncbi:unnamed protein product [Durusdinium trenchii]|uniref:Uncharacterized protein n=1 Tax=Durusdinium trenchii TaxID=1381693 RepID=A0ABP0PWZ0_9DINO
MEDRQYQNKKTSKRNALDLLSPGGFALLLAAILQSQDGVVVHFGLVCSTFIAISRGSTYRSYFRPEGDPSSPSVARSNLLAARTCLAILLVMAKRGVWVLEQPSSSLAFRLRRFQDQLVRKTRVYRQSFWMRGWGATTPKRTTLWSNSTAVRFFSTSKKARSIGKGKGPKLAEVYHDKSGRKRYKGIPQALRKSQEYPVGFGLRFAQTMKRFLKERSPLLSPHPAPSPNHLLPCHVMPQPEIDDLWADAKMEEVIEYLARASSLRAARQRLQTLADQKHEQPASASEAKGVADEGEDPGLAETKVSQEIYRQWKCGGVQRRALLDTLIASGGDKDLYDAFKKKIEHLQKRTRKNKFHVERGFYTKEAMAKELKWSKRDLYEKKIKEYWVNVKTTGAYEQEHEESLVDRTVGEGTAEAFNLGLPAEGDGAMLPEEAEPGADTDLDDPDLEDGNASAGTSKFPGKAQVERESVLEAVENVGTVMTNLLRVQTRMETLRDRLAATDSPEAKASKNKVEGFRTKLMTYHDELADLKSYFDGQHHDDVFDQEKLDC